MGINFRLVKESALIYKELDDNFVYLDTQLSTLNNQVSSIFRGPLNVSPCNNPNVWPLNSYVYYARQACTSSFPWWTGSNGVGILASETYATLDATALGAVAFGSWNAARAANSLAFNVSCSAIGIGSTAEGENTIASGSYSHAEGYYTIARGTGSHAEGSGSLALGNYSHAEGEKTLASGFSSHAEGVFTTASGDYSHAEGYLTIARGIASHAEGFRTQANGYISHAEGYATTASHTGSHADGHGTSTGLDYQIVTGRFNLLNNTSDYFVIGDGSSPTARSNAFGVNSSSIYLSNSIYLPDLSSAPQTFALTFNTSSKQVFFVTASSVGKGLVINDEGVLKASSAFSINFIGNGVTTSAIGNAVTVNVPNLLFLPIKDEGNLLTNNPSEINFTGDRVTATRSGNAVTVTIPNLFNVYDEGTLVTSSFTTLNFTGSRVSASRGTNGVIDVYIPSFDIYDENTSNLVTNSPIALNFTGSGVSASRGTGGNVNVYIPGIGIPTTAVGDPGAVQLSDGAGNFNWDVKVFFDQTPGYLWLLSLYQSGSLRLTPRNLSMPFDTLQDGDYTIIADADALGSSVIIDFNGGTFTPYHGSILRFIIKNNASTQVQLDNVTLYGTAGYSNPIFTNEYETITIIYYDPSGTGGRWQILKAYNSSL